jgi:hypothetical protein
VLTNLHVTANAKWSGDITTNVAWTVTTSARATNSTSAEAPRSRAARST